MKNLLICGINGAMGKHVYNASTKYQFNVVCGIDKQISGTTECPVYKSFEEVRDLIDVIIDFSSPDAIEEILQFALNNKTPLVLGTTGYTEKEENTILCASKEIPIFKSANMSIGINLLIKLCKIVFPILENFDVEIIEKHHKNKKDSPSGTANLIYDNLIECSNKKITPIYGRNGKKKRSNFEIGIHSVRGGTVVGEHEVSFYGENETISLVHTAQSKELFAYGALKCAKFIQNQPAKLYNMEDILVL